MDKKKKISRKQLLKEPDEFITFSGKMFNFAVEHKTQLTYAGCLIVVLFLMISGYRFFSIRTEKKARAMLAQAVAKYEAAYENQDSKKAYQAVAADFEQILNKYGNKEGGKIARVTFANICFDAGEYGKAIEFYKNSLKDFENHPFIHNLILLGIGYAYEQLNDDQTAASYFEKIAASNEYVLQDQAFFNLGVLYDRLGEKQKSSRAFERIISDHQDSIYFNLVKERPSG
jgi:tetratricopeptide (TPR) repeat protein